MQAALETNGVKRLLNNEPFQVVDAFVEWKKSTKKTFHSMIRDNEICFESNKNTVYFLFYNKGTKLSCPRRLKCVRAIYAHCPKNTEKVSKPTTNFCRW